MRVQLKEQTSKRVVYASIVGAKKLKIRLPDISDGWRFNFRKHVKKKNFEAYVLICDTTPEEIEGCLIFEMRNELEPYIAYIEIAPHNTGEKGRYDHVAGCLIAFACRLSFIYGKGDYQGWLAFDVLEESVADENKLMALYSSRYNALRLGNSTTMIIPPEGGEKLIKKFLKISV